MLNEIITVYAIIDDLLKAIGHYDDCRRDMSDRTTFHRKLLEVNNPQLGLLEDGSYLSWIAPDGQSKKKGGTKIIVRVIEYTIDTDDQSQVYRLITSLGDFNSVTAPCFTSTDFGNEIKACVHVACRRQGRLRLYSRASALR